MVPQLPQNRAPKVPRAILFHMPGQDTEANSSPSKLVLSDDQTRSLSQAYGTPLYVFSEPVFRSRIRGFRDALLAQDPRARLGYATKANSNLAVLRIAASEGCLLDVASEGELEAALHAGVPGSSCYLHGNNKTEAEILLAIENKLDHIVVDNFEELAKHARLQTPLPLVLRLAPGVDPKTHAKIRTGQNDTKFGFPLDDETLDQALEQIKHAGLDWAGVHCHVGSQLMDGTSQREGALALVEAAARLQSKHELPLRLLNLGGGLGVAYLPNQSPLGFPDFQQSVVPDVRKALDAVNPDAVLMQEPGRALGADAGVTLYEVGAVKEVTTANGHKTYVVVNGGLADNPRPGLYSAYYTVNFIPQEPRDLKETKTVTVAGRHCETDTLFPDIELPADVQEGDLLQVLTTGAYNFSMASNYNRYPRPAMVLLRTEGSADIVHRPETWDEMFGRETVPEGL